MKMINIDDVEGPLTELQHMAQFAAGLAANGLSGHPDGFFQIPTKEGNQLAFCTYDILRRVDELLESISSPAK
jgi:hypothetical protein